jgi:D-ribose pyranase
MLKSGILNPAILSLIARLRHTNTLVIADRGFPYWSELETIDISLVDGLPTVNQVLEALLSTLEIGQAFMAGEFRELNSPEVLGERLRILAGIPLDFEDHEAAFKKRVPSAIGLIRTGDTTLYSNIILVSS